MTSHSSGNNKGKQHIVHTKHIPLHWYLFFFLGTHTLLVGAGYKPLSCDVDQHLHMSELDNLLEQDMLLVEDIVLAEDMAAVVGSNLVVGVHPLH